MRHDYRIFRDTIARTRALDRKEHSSRIRKADQLAISEVEFNSYQINYSRKRMEMRATDGNLNVAIRPTITLVANAGKQILFPVCYVTCSIASTRCLLLAVRSPHNGGGKPYNKRCFVQVAMRRSFIKLHMKRTGFSLGWNRKWVAFNLFVGRGSK